MILPPVASTRAGERASPHSSPACYHCARPGRAAGARARARHKRAPSSAIPPAPPVGLLPACSPAWRHRRRRIGRLRTRGHDAARRAPRARTLSVDCARSGAARRGAMSADAGELGRSGGGNERAREQLFFPPLAQQRTELLARVLRRSGATAVVDLGCGERASTLRRLATGSVRGERRTDEQMRAARAARDGAEPFKFAPPPFRSLQLAELLGVELREQAAEQAVEAIKTRSAALAEKAPRTRIYLGDMLDAPPPELRDIIRGENDDGGANGLVWASEVVEHLDPEPLGRFPAALLGGHPQVAVVTTPNADYNVHLPGVRRPCDGAERPFRDPDHRFEWTRAQFQEWAKAAAFTHGYEVEFAGVGSLPNSDLLKALKKRLHQSLALFYSASTLDIERPKPEGLPPGAGALRHLLHEGSDASMPPLEEGLTLDELEADVDAALGALSTSVIFDSLSTLLLAQTGPKFEQLRAAVESDGFGLRHVRFVVSWRQLEKATGLQGPKDRCSLHAKNASACIQVCRNDSTWCTVSMGKLKLGGTSSATRAASKHATESGCAGEGGEGQDRALVTCGDDASDGERGCTRCRCLWSQGKRLDCWNCSKDSAARLGWKAGWITEICRPAQQVEGFCTQVAVFYRRSDGDNFDDVRGNTHAELDSRKGWTLVWDAGSSHERMEAAAKRRAERELFGPAKRYRRSEGDP